MDNSRQNSYNVNIGGQNGLNLLINYSNNNIISPPRKNSKKTKKKGLNTLYESKN